MKVVAFMSLLVFVYSAPLNEQNAEQEILQQDAKVNLVKRAKEVMMFENEQNELKDKEKRSDPAELENTIDQQGEIVAKQPIDIIPETTSSEQMEPEMPSKEELPVDVNMAVNAPEEDRGSEEEDVLQENNLEDAEDEISDESDVENVNNDDNLKPEVEMYDDYLKSYGKGDGSYLLDLLGNQYGRLEPSYQNNPYNVYDYLAAGRYRRSRATPLRKAFPKSRVLKRARRIKRDLYFTSDILGRNNFNNYNPYDDQYLEMPVENETADLNDDEIRYLVDLLEEENNENEATGYDDELYPAQYAGYLEPQLDSDDSGFYIPKRQAGLTFVPGLKRSRGDFYPYFTEPYSHFSAFVPQKRSMEEYADAYQRLMGLAAELRAESYYPENEYGNYYRRK